MKQICSTFSPANDLSLNALCIKREHYCARLMRLSILYTLSDDDDDVAPSSSSAADALAMETRLVVLFAVKQTPPNPVFLGKIEEVNRDDMVFVTIIFLLGRLSVVLLFSSVIAKRLRVNV